jgi:hypothetical protein
MHLDHSGQIIEKSFLIREELVFINVSMNIHVDLTQMLAIAKITLTKTTELLYKT